MAAPAVPPGQSGTIDYAALAQAIVDSNGGFTSADIFYALSTLGLVLCFVGGVFWGYKMIRGWG